MLGGNDADELFGATTQGKNVERKPWRHLLPAGHHFIAQNSSPTLQLRHRAILDGIGIAAGFPAVLHHANRNGGSGRYGADAGAARAQLPRRSDLFSSAALAKPTEPLDRKKSQSFTRVGTELQSKFKPPTKAINLRFTHWCSTGRTEP